MNTIPLFNETVSSLVSFILVLTVPTFLSIIASSLAIIWWLLKFKEKYHPAARRFYRVKIEPIINRLLRWFKKSKSNG